MQLPKSGTRDDLAQETYLRALQSLPSYEARAPFPMWLLAIARRTCADALRRRHRRCRLLTRLQSGPVEVVPDPAGDIAATDLLRRLEPDRRVALLLTQMLGLPYAEAADVCAVPVGTIRSRVARARRRASRHRTPNRLR